MTDLSVREAGPSDAGRVAELRRRARTEAATRRGGPELAQATPDELPSESTVLVAEVDGVALAYAVVRVQGTTAVLHELFTEPRARDVGLGHALLGAAEQRARDRGCTALESVALPGDRDTKNFFESHGLRARLLVVHRELDAR